MQIQLHFSNSLSKNMVFKDIFAKFAPQIQRAGDDGKNG